MKRIAKAQGETVAVSGALDRYRQLVESLTKYAIFSLSPDGRIANWNSGAAQTFGYQEDEVVGQNYSLIFTASDVASGRPEAELAASAKLGTSAVDGWHVRKNGSRFWSTGTLQSLRGPSGRVSGFTRVVRDFTDRHIAAERVRKSEERLRVLIEGVTDYAILSIDERGLIVLWNSGAELIFGYPEAEVLGKHFSLIYTAEAVALGIPQAELAAATLEGRARDEGWHVRRNGDLFFASGEMTRLEAGADGTPRGFVKIARDVTARNEADEKIKRQAFSDELTQLPNRAFFCDSLRRSIARAKRHPKVSFAVIFLDLDRFKVINDSLGHVLADELLVRVARTLEGCVRPDDVVARLGGDEFTILLSDIGDVHDAVVVAARVQTALQQAFVLGGFEVLTTASMGIAIGTAAYDEPEQILRDADTAMYEAKARGRSQHVLFDSAMHGRAAGLLDLQMDLRRASARLEFFIEYQPIVCLERCRVTGFEALVRWNHPRRGVLLPGDFLAEADNIGAIVDIDRWVLEEACRQIAVWQREHADDSLTVSVNLSSKQFGDDRLINQIEDALRRNNLAARSLKFEISEAALIERFETTAAHLGALGVDLQIDDFGIGYSSLSHLTRFPLNLLKIDRSFVSAISASARSAVVAHTVVTLAHNLGLAALAEGIETHHQFSQLRDFGCEFGQGYYFSEPLGPAAAELLIGRVLPIAEVPTPSGVP